LGTGGSVSSMNIIVNGGATFDVSAISYTLPAGRTLTGNGSVSGNVAAAGTTSVIAPGMSGVGTLTFAGNLNLGSGAAPVFELSTTAASGNDQLVVGGNLTLSSSDSIHISALSGAADLDVTADYVLFSVAGATTMTTTPSLAWDGTAPANYLNYTIQKVGQNVVLHHITATAPSVTATATPTTLMRNNSVTIAATVTPGSGNITSVTADATSIGGSVAAILVPDGSQLPTLVYTNTFVVSAGTPAGTKPLTVFVADDSSPTPLTGTFGFSVAVTIEGNLTWNGSAADDNWTSNLNWDGGFAPGYVGDSLTFAGTTRLTPSMNANYSLTGLTFDGTAGSFAIGTANGSALTNGTGGIVNNSANAQTLNVPVKLSASQTVNAAGADITLGGGVNGIGSVNLTTTGAGVVTLSGGGSGTINDLHVQNQLKVTSGTTTVDGILEVGNGLTGVLTLSGGTLSAINSAFWVSVQLGQNGGDGTFNLDGGTLVARSIRSLGGNTGAATLNFNGGVLKAAQALTVSYDAFLQELTTINVRNGGAIIDTAGYNVIIPGGQPLNHSSLGGDNATDGGLTKNGNGTLTLDSNNTYTGPTTINGGTLAGNGTIQGVLTNSATLAPGDGGTGALTVNGNITLKAGSTNTFTVNGTTSANSSVIVGAAVTYGGVLKILPSGSFAAGQTFTLFNGAGATSSSSFSGILGSPGTGLGFTFTNGVLSVVSTGPTGPAALTNSFSGGVLSLSWPAGQGWRLQMQTNSLSVGLGTNWEYITDGSASSTNITVDVTKPTAFYRLTYP
jgi:fibronectin-binding autotransporter adhesin